MVDKAATIKEAQKLLAKGQVDKAIAEWEKLSAAYPESNTFNFIGDLYLKKGDKLKAAENYHQASAIFRKEGFTLKALALYKKILNINPSDADALYILGQLNEEKSIVVDAAKYYLASADIYARDNRKKELVEVYERIIKLAPSNIPLRARLAEMFSKHAFVAEASNECLQIGILHAREGNAEQCRKFFLKSAELQPGNRDALIALSRLFEKQGDIVQALRYAHLAIERVGEDKELLLLAANLHSVNGDTAEALKLLTKLLEAQPNDIDARKTLADLYNMTGNSERAWQEYSALVDSMAAGGRAEEAAGILEPFKSTEPVEARKMLVSLYRQTGKEQAAAGELLELARHFENNDLKEEALASLREALLIRPDDAEIKGLIGELEGELYGTKEAGTETEPFEPSPEPEMEVSGFQGMPGEAASPPEADSSGKSLDEMLVEADIFIRYGLYPEAKKLLEELKLREPANVDVHRKLKGFYMETGERDALLTECIILAELFGRQGDSDGRMALLMEAYALNPEDPRLAGKLPETTKPATVQEVIHEAPPIKEPVLEEEPDFTFDAAEALGSLTAPETPPSPAIADYSEDIAQAEFYADEGMNSEALEILDRLLSVFPDNDDLRSKQKVLLKARTASPPLEVVRAQTEEAAEPAIDSEVLEMFEEFKKGLEKELSTEDAETHYNLGIAYREMGLVDDAIKAFQAARRDPKQFIGATGMLGLCYMQKGLYPLAIDSFQSALLKCRPEESWGIKYELAEAYDKNGNQIEALRLFTEVYGWDSKFRDTAKKIEALKKSVDSGQKAKDRRSRVSYI